jgi:hypothetical protein
MVDEAALVAQAEDALAHLCERAGFEAPRPGRTAAVSH